MSTYTKLILSGSTDGRPIKVAATASPGTTVHTAPASGLDEVYLWLTNTDTVARTVTVQFGGTGDPDDAICKTVSLPANSPPIPLIMGLPLQNSLVVKVFASAANVVLASGYVNRIQ